MIIYSITNKINGKVYVGQTSQAIERRWSRHKNGYKKKRPSAISLAISKYGEANFELTTLAEALDFEHLNMLEAFFIRTFKSMAPGGYNLTTGGDYKQLSELTKQKISKTLTGRPGRKGNNLSPIQLQQIGLRLRGRKQSPENIQKRAMANRKPVLCSNGQVFESIIGAGAALGINKNGICANLNGRQKTAGGFTFSYLKKDVSISAAQNEKKGEG